MNMQDKLKDGSLYNKISEILLLSAYAELAAFKKEVEETSPWYCRAGGHQLSQTSSDLKGGRI